MAYGLAQLDPPTALRVDHVFRIGSITKQFTAAAIMQLQEAGALDLDAKVASCLSGYRVPDHGITIRQLLTHSSGIPCFTEQAGFEQFEVKELTVHERLAFFVHLPLSFKPGERFAYSNSGYYLLGLVIEELSGLDLAIYFRERLFVPLGMNSTGLEGHGGLWPIQGFTDEGQGIERSPDISMSLPFSAGALLSTLDDLRRWELAMQSSALLSAAAWQQMWSPALLSDGEPVDYGFGFEFQTLNGLPVVEHGGGIAGFNTYTGRSRDRRFFVAVLMNNDSAEPDAMELGQQLLRQLAQA